MADSMFASLLNMLDERTVSDVAHALGQPEQSVSQGMESSIATLLSGLASKSNDPGSLRKILDTVPGTDGPVSWSQMLRAFADSASPLMASGRSLLPALFGNNENAVISGISRSSGLPSGTIPTLLSMTGPVVMSFISKRARDGGMTMNSLAGLLQRESGSIRNALPAGLSEVFWPATETAGKVSPVVTQSTQREASSNWLLPVLCGALALGALGWLFAHMHRPRIEQAKSVNIGEASRLPVPATTPGCTLPASITLPKGSVESRLLASLQNGSNKALETTWFNFDQLSFDTGSAKLRPESEATLRNMAAILTNCPTVHMAIAGYTDNVGNAESNLRLSQNRANSVIAELVRMGVPQDRLSVEAFGENHPVAGNATAEGRAENRHVAIRVTQR